MSAVIVGCEKSGAVRDAILARNEGHKVLSCDVQPTTKPGPHYEGDLFDVLDYPWDTGIFHTPCTATSVSGAKHFEEKWNDGRQACGVAFMFKVRRLSKHIRGRVFEQPVSIISTLWRKPDFIVQPWMFGDFEVKATCFWLEGYVDRIVPIYKTVDECREALGLPPDAKPLDRVHKLPPSANRADLRSATYPGIAKELARIIA